MVINIINKLAVPVALMTITSSHEALARHHHSTISKSIEEEGPNEHKTRLTNNEEADAWAAEDNLAERGLQYGNRNRNKNINNNNNDRRNSKKKKRSHDRRKSERRSGSRSESKPSSWSGSSDSRSSGSSWKSSSTKSTWKSSRSSSTDSWSSSSSSWEEQPESWGCGWKSSDDRATETIANNFHNTAAIMTISGCSVFDPQTINGKFQKASPTPPTPGQPTPPGPTPPSPSQAQSGPQRRIQAGNRIPSLPAQYVNEYGVPCDFVHEEHASKTWGSASTDSTWGSSTSGSKTWGSSSKDSNSWGSSSKDSNWGKGKYEGAFTNGVTSDYGNGSSGFGSMTNAGTFTGAGGKGSDDTEFNIGGTMKNNNSKRSSRESNSNWSSSGSSSASKETWKSSSGSSSSKDSWASSNSKDTWASLASRDGWAAAATKEPNKVVTNTWYNSAQVETFTGGSQFNPQTINGFTGTIAAADGTLHSTFAGPNDQRRRWRNRKLSSSKNFNRKLPSSKESSWSWGCGWGWEWEETSSPAPTLAPTAAPTVSPTGLCIEGQDGPGSGGTSCTTTSDCCLYTASNKQLTCTLQTGDTNNPGGAMKCE